MQIHACTHTHTRSRTGTCTSTRTGNVIFRVPCSKFVKNFKTAEHEIMQVALLSTGVQLYTLNRPPENWPSQTHTHTNKSPYNSCIDLHAHICTDMPTLMLTIMYTHIHSYTYMHTIQTRAHTLSQCTLTHTHTPLIIISVASWLRSHPRTPARGRGKRAASMEEKGRPTSATSQSARSHTSSDALGSRPPSPSRAPRSHQGPELAPAGPARGAVLPEAPQANAAVVQFIWMRLA